MAVNRQVDKSNGLSAGTVILLGIFLVGLYFVYKLWVVLQLGPGAEVKEAPVHRADISAGAVPAESLFCGEGSFRNGSYCRWYGKLQIAAEKASKFPSCMTVWAVGISPSSVDPVAPHFFANCYDSKGKNFKLTFAEFDL